MAEIQCENCSLRAKYDERPKSILGRFWKWHIRFCPGWRAYIKSLDDEKRQEIIFKYKLKMS